MSGQGRKDRPAPGGLIPILTVLLLVLLPGIISAAAPVILVCGGDAGTVYTFNTLNQEFICYDAGGHVLRRTVIITNSGPAPADPVDMEFQSPDRLLLLDRQNREFYEFNSDFDFISRLRLPDDILHPAAFIIDDDNRILLYDDLVQQIFEVRGHRSAPFHVEQLFTGAKDRGAELFRYGGDIGLYFPEEAKLTVFNRRGQILKQLEPKQEAAANTSTCLPLSKNRILLYGKDRLVVVDINSGGLAEYPVNGLLWCDRAGGRLLILEKRGGSITFRHIEMEQDTN